MKKAIKITALSLVFVMMLAMLASCGAGAPNADPEKAEAALEKNGYAVIGGGSKYDYEGIKDVIIGTKLDLSVSAAKVDIVIILYFDSAESANAVWDEVKKDLEGESDEAEGFIVNKSGAMIYAGTPDAINAAK